LLQQITLVNEKLPSKKVYDAIFVDEVQDLTLEELEVLLCLSERVCVCGDLRQGIYEKDGLGIANKLGLTKHVLSKHFRIGHRIAQVADRLLPPAEGTISLEGSSNYDASIMGKSTARLHECASRDAQFSQILESVRVQLDAYPEDTIGVFCARSENLKDLRTRFDATDLSKAVVVHGLDANPSFISDARIHVMTIHSAKGTEFRSVHMFGVEEFSQNGFRRTKLAYTAVTRAKTSLNAYRTGRTSPKLESAFAEPKVVDPADLF
jgi:superfamily I DNA/RNA helicase